LIILAYERRNNQFNFHEINKSFYANEKRLYFNILFNSYDLNKLLIFKNSTYDETYDKTYNDD
jgi:hypothetical protein